MEGRRKREEGRQEDSLGLSSGADQGPRCVGIYLISPVMADAEATELQGDGEALGGNTRKKRKTRSKTRLDEAEFMRGKIEGERVSKIAGGLKGRGWAVADKPGAEACRRRSTSWCRIQAGSSRENSSYASTVRDHRQRRHR